MIIYRWNQWAKPIKIGRSFNFYNDLASLALVRFTATTHKQKHSSIHSPWMYLSIHTHRKKHEKENADQREFPIKVNFIMKPANLFKMYDCLNHTGALSTIGCITGFFFLLQNCYVVFFCVRFALTDPVCGKVFNGHKKKWLRKVYIILLLYIYCVDRQWQWWQKSRQRLVENVNYLICDQHKFSLCFFF